MRAPPASKRPMIGQRAFIAMSCTLMIFCACVSDSEPPNTVKSLEKRYTARPLTVPQPVTTPSPGIFDFSMPNSFDRCSTNMSNSSNDPLSSSSSMRSRAVNLPRLCWASMRALPPPRRASSRRFSSLSRMSFISALAPALHTSEIPVSEERHTMRPNHRHSRDDREANEPAAERLGIALKACLQAPMSEPRTAAELIEQGLAHHRAGQVSLAMDRYTQVLRNDPRNADALYYIAVIACHEGQYQQGIDLARRSLSFRPGQARAHNLIGQALHRMGNIKDALESFDNAIECDTSFADAYSNRANMLSDLGRNSEALSSFDRALALNPNSAGDWLNRGATLHGAGRPADAVASYDKAIALEPKMAEAYLGRALALKKLVRHDEALASVDKAIDIKPDAAKMHEARASLLRLLGRNEEANTADTLAAELATKNSAENS